jgi:hypothetical protein
VFHFFRGIEKTETKVPREDNVNGGCMSIASFVTQVSSRLQSERALALVFPFTILPVGWKLLNNMRERERDG